MAKQVRVDDAPSAYTLFYEAVVTKIEKEYVATRDEAGSCVRGEQDTVREIFQDGANVDEAVTVIAVLNDLEDR